MNVQSLGSAKVMRPLFGTGAIQLQGKPRVLIAKPGLDGHSAGAKIVARALRDAGMEVIYTGLRQSPAAIAQAALQEDVDIVGLSILSGSHLRLVQKVTEEMKKHGVDQAALIVGGVIPPEDVPALKGLGVKEVFGPGSSTENIVTFVRSLVKNK